MILDRKKVRPTLIKVEPPIWSLLRAFSTELALEVGGRPSVSAVVANLVLAEAARRETESHQG